MKNRIAAFKHAFNGVVCFFKETPHAKIQALAAVLVVLAGFFLNISTTEWAIVLLCFALIFSLEALNSTVEYLVDLVSPNYHQLAKKAKDVAAAAVLMAAVFTVIIACLIFVPKIIAL